MKLVLLFNLLLGGGAALARELVSSDRFLFKVLDRTISLQDIQYQHRNLKSLDCIYSDSFVVFYFHRPFLKDLGEFLAGFPEGDEEVRRYMHKNDEMLKKLRSFFKLLRYTEDQKEQVSPKLKRLVREAARENKCDLDVLHKDSLKTNFLGLLQMELYFRARYGGQLKNGAQGLETVRPSIDLFMESLDKQFGHEYYW